MEKKKLEDIQTPSAVQEIKTAHEKFGTTISINACFGSSDLGQLSGAASAEIRNRIPHAFMRCPLALFPELEGPSQALIHDDYHVAIDGCSQRCLSKTLEKAGVKVHLSYALDDDFGLERHAQPTPFKDEHFEQVVEKIHQDIEQHIEKLRKQN